ncbi:MAG: AI-2E family transporter, partial [Chloroflexia bacterium]|nr:AI-2E family transporter [Chloroflexia bacterium]
MEESIGSTWTRPTRYVVGIGLAIFAVFLVFISNSVIPLLVVAGLLAFTVRPVISLLHERLRLPYGLAVGLTYLVVLLLLPLAALILLSAIGQALTFVFNIDYERAISGFTNAVQGWMEGLKAWEIPFGSLDTYVDAIADAVLVALDGASQVAQPEIPPLADLAEQLGSALTVTFGAVAG